MTNTRAEQTARAREGETTAANWRGYQNRPFLKIRRGYTDLLTATKRKNIIHGLVEMDVTNAHRLLRHREAAGEDLSFTAFLMHAVARAVDEDRIMHTYRRRGRLILFDDVDVNTQIESAVGGQAIVQPLLIRSVSHKSVEQLSREIRAGQHHDQPSERRYRPRWRFSACRDRSARCLVGHHTDSCVCNPAELHRRRVGTLQEVRLVGRRRDNLRHRGLGCAHPVLGSRAGGGETNPWWNVLIHAVGAVGVVLLLTVPVLASWVNGHVLAGR